MNRRELLKAMAVSGAALAAERLHAEPASREPASQPVSSDAGRLPRRPYGKAGDRLSIIGFPGFALNRVDQEEANRAVATALDRGVNYFDVAPEYGTAEERLGPALEPHRKKVFLACKTAQRRREEAAGELKRSLDRLRTDHFDLYQLHHIQDLKKDVDVAFSKGGVMEVLIEAKKSGRVRHLGFSAHSVEAALAAMDRYDFDSILFPVNFAACYRGRFGPEAIEVARSKGVDILALKGMAWQKWGADKEDAKYKRYHGRCWYEPITDPADAEQSLRWTLSEPVVAAVPPADLSLLPLALDIGMRFRPISETETNRLKSRAEKLQPVFHRA